MAVVQRLSSGLIFRLDLMEDALSVLASEGAEEREEFFSGDPALDLLPLIPLPRELIPLDRKSVV